MLAPGSLPDQGLFHKAAFLCDLCSLAAARVTRFRWFREAISEQTVPPGGKLSPACPLGEWGVTGRSVLARPGGLESVEGSRYLAGLGGMFSKEKILR